MKTPKFGNVIRGSDLPGQKGEQFSVLHSIDAGDHFAVTIAGRLWHSPPLLVVKLLKDSWGSGWLVV